MFYLIFFLSIVMIQNDDIDPISLQDTYWEVQRIEIYIENFAIHDDDPLMPGEKLNYILDYNEDTFIEKLEKKDTTSIRELNSQFYSFVIAFEDHQMILYRYDTFEKSVHDVSIDKNQFIVSDYCSYGNADFDWKIEDNELILIRIEEDINSKKVNKIFMKPLNNREQSGSNYQKKRCISILNPIKYE